jgi:hypothetical protein
MRAEQRSRSLAQRCEEILALIDAVLSEYGIGASPTRPRQPGYAGVEGAVHVAP